MTARTEVSATVRMLNEEPLGPSVTTMISPMPDAFRRGSNPA